MTALLLSQLAPGRHERPARISRELRNERSAEMARRRGIVGLALVGAGAMAVVSMYQTGIIRHVPEPPLPGLDADRVDASDEAYARFSVPDGLLGLVNYGVTATLAATGGTGRAERRPWVSLATAGKVLTDAVMAAKLTYVQFSRHRAACSWCLLGALASFAMIPLIFPEARHALRRVRQDPWVR